MRVFYDKIKQILSEKTEWPKRELHDRLLRLRVTKQEYPQILKELKANGEVKITKRTVKLS